ncbi:hypothetical protein ACFX1S_018937 [Malus domestica]
MRKLRPQATRPKEEPKPAPRTSVFDKLNHSKPRISTLDHISGQDQTSVFKGLKTPRSQRSVFEKLSKPKKQSGTARSPPQRLTLDKLEETKKPSRKRKTTQKEEKLDRLAGKDDVQSLIPSRMKGQATLEVDAKGPLKVKRRTIIYTANLHANKPKRTALKMRPKKTKKMKSRKKTSLPALSTQNLHLNRWGYAPKPCQSS